MTNPESPKSLDEALLALQADPPVLTKNKDGQAGNQKTRYADLVQVNLIVLNRLNGYGVMYVCQPTLLDDGKFVLTYELKHVASGTTRNGNYPLKLSENPQQMGSAISYARRYALLAVTGIAAEDEDDDGRGAGGQQTAQRANRQQQRAAQPAAAANTARRASNTPPPLPGEDNNGLITKPQQGKMQALFAEQGYVERADKLAFANQHITRTVTSAGELTVTEARQVIDALVARSEAPAGAGIPAGGEA